MELLSKELVSLEYAERLRQDLSKAKVCRFLVAYISKEGLRTLNGPQRLLVRALIDPSSFGVASISCACGYKPLVNLQEEVGASLRLKYFMDPMVKPEQDPEVSLFHSKLIYLFLEQERKSVVYIGSHNWTARALGPRGPRNAEASIRFEFEFDSNHLEGIGTSVPAEVNRHLLDAWNAPASLPASSTSERAFDQWMQKGCKRSLAPVREITIILAVCRTLPSQNEWLKLTNSAGIYMQALNEDEGRRVYESNQALVFVWESVASLQAGEQPILLNCKKTASNAGPKSQLAGNNAAPSPMEGFRAVIFDANHSETTTTPPIRIWSGREISVFDFEFPTTRTQSAQIDGPTEPLYQIYMQTEVVIFPADRAPAEAGYVWERETFAVAENKNEAKFEESPGYFALPEVERSIIDFFRKVLQVEPQHAKVLPYSEERSTVGKRLSRHPLHDAFIGQEARSAPETFYSKSSSGMLIPDIREHAEREPKSSRHDGPLARVQRVFTMPLKELLDLWKATARRVTKKGSS